MYRKPDDQMTIDVFKLTFEVSLSSENRWVKMAELILWEEIAYQPPN